MINFFSKIDKDTAKLLIHSKRYLSAIIISKVIYIVSVPIFTRWLSVSEYGIFSVFVSLLSILIIFYLLGINGAIPRYYYEDKNDFKLFMSSNLNFLLIWTFTISIVIVINRSILSALVVIPEYLVVVLGVVAFFSSIFEVLKSYLQASQKSFKYNILSVTKTLFFVLLSLGLFYLLKQKHFLSIYISYIIIALFFFIYSIVYFRKHKLWKYYLKRDYLTYSLSFGSPVVLHLLSLYILNNFDQVMINKMVGSKAVGLYSIAYQISMIYLFIIMGINQAWVPLFYEKMKNKEYVNIDNVLKRYSIFISILAVGFVIISPYLVKLLTTSDYLKAINVLPVIVIGFMFQYLYVQLVNYSFYEKKTLNIAIFSLLAASVNVALNYFLIPKFGYVAAAWTTVVSYVLLFLLHYINVKYVLKIKNIVNLKIIVVPVFIAIIIVGIYTCVI